MAMQILTYDDKNIEIGKFYIPQVNLDLAPALVAIEDMGILKVANFSVNDFSVDSNGIIHLLPKPLDPEKGITVNVSPVITTNQNCGDGYNETKTITLNSNSHDPLLVSPLDCDAIFLDYVLKNSIGHIEAGRLIIINDDVLSNAPKEIQPSRTANGSILPVIYIAHKDSIGIYLNVSPSNTDNYVFKYKLSKI